MFRNGFRQKFASLFAAALILTVATVPCSVAQNPGKVKPDFSISQMAGTWFATSLESPDAV